MSNNKTHKAINLDFTVTPDYKALLILQGLDKEEAINRLQCIVNDLKMNRTKHITIEQI